ncbi:MAG: insulinase family protein, partial [Azonexus sp.]|nr:insulinase family protein [Azonexus sp.]
MKPLLTAVFSARLSRLWLAPLVLLLGLQQAIATVAIEHWTTSNGARVYFVAAPSLPMLDVQVDFAAGSMFDPPGKAGLAALTRGILDLGTQQRDETAISEQLADIGAALGGGADTDRASVSLRTLTDADK